MNKLIIKAIIPKAVERVDRGLCPVCGKSIDQLQFEDEISIREFEISGLCQSCQNEDFKSK